MKELAIVIACIVIALGSLGRPAPVTATEPRATTAAPALATAETLLGAWSGRWAAEGAKAEGSMGLVLARIPGKNDVVGQFTFITGGVTRSLRYEGRMENGRVEFPLVGEGQIVLEPFDASRVGRAARLRGAWTDARGALPAPQGVIELSRTN